MKAASTLLLLLLLPLPARADEGEPMPSTQPEAATPPAETPTETPTPGSYFIEPNAGLRYGRWFGVPVSRTEIGVAVSYMRSKDSIVGPQGSFFAAKGSTENGLGAHRIELGFGVATRPWYLRAGAGGHLSYAMLQRATTQGTLFDALGGNIGGFGLGAHALVEASLPLGSVVAVTVGLRGSADVYDGGYGFEGGPFAGLRL